MADPVRPNIVRSRTNGLATTAWRALRRPRAFWISVCNVIGLICSMVGVVLLFWFALPNRGPGAPGVMLFNEASPGFAVEQERYQRNAYIGLVLVLLGTILEAVPPVCTAIGCWRWRSVPPRATSTPRRKGTIRGPPRSTRPPRQGKRR